MDAEHSVLLRCANRHIRELTIDFFAMLQRLQN